MDTTFRTRMEEQAANNEVMSYPWTKFSVHIRTTSLTIIVKYTTAS